jgi:hypothetical protein
MRYEDASTPACDTTLQALATTTDDSQPRRPGHNLLRQELDTIRALPERRDRDRDPATPADRH